MNFGIFHTAKNVYPDVFEELLKSDYVDVFLSEGEAAEFCAGINKNDLGEIHIDEIRQDAVNIISFV